MVAWSSCYSEPGEYQARPCDRTHVAVQSLGADGSTDGSSVVASGVEPGYQGIGPLDAAVHDSGRFTVVWSGLTVGGDARGLVARQFTPALKGSGAALLVEKSEFGPCGEAGNAVDEDPTGSQNGIVRVRFRVRPRGRALLVVRAAGPNVPTFELPAPLPIGVLFVGGLEGTTESSFCAGAVFDQAEVNGPGDFLAVGAATP